MSDESTEFEHLADRLRSGLEQFTSHVSTNPPLAALAGAAAFAPTDPLNEAGSLGYDEGWGIFEPCDEDHPPLELQADEETKIFTSDEEAWEFVWRRANDGSEGHLKALLLLRRESWREFVNISSHMMTVRDIALKHVYDMLDEMEKP